MILEPFSSPSSCLVSFLGGSIFGFFGGCPSATSFSPVRFFPLSAIETRNAVYFLTNKKRNERRHFTKKRHFLSCLYIRLHDIQLLSDEESELIFRSWSSLNSEDSLRFLFRLVLFVFVFVFVFRSGFFSTEPKIDSSELSLFRFSLFWVFVSTVLFSALGTLSPLDCVVCACNIFCRCFSAFRFTTLRMKTMHTVVLNVNRSSKRKTNFFWIYFDRSNDTEKNNENANECKIAKYKSQIRSEIFCKFLSNNVGDRRSWTGYVVRVRNGIIGTHRF